MGWRTVIVSSHAKLDLMVGFMQIRAEGGTRRVILDEIDILMIESTAVSLTSALVEELVARKVRIVFCDRRHFPIAELTPCHGCHDSSRRLRQQLGWQPCVRGDVWRSIVQEKIRNQSALLRRLGKLKACEVLDRYADDVVAGDTGNREGLAARLYFTTLFGVDFTRDNPCDVNLALDYGYQVMLAAFAREVSAEGFVTELGIFHDNVFNRYNLASDLIEPFRPLVDSAVWSWASSEDAHFDKEIRRRLVQLLHEEISISGTSQTVLNAIASYTRSVTEALTTGCVEQIRFPAR